VMRRTGLADSWAGCSAKFHKNPRAFETKYAAKCKFNGENYGRGLP
jgi:hypothetical protein